MALCVAGHVDMQAYIDNLKATGQVESGCIIGLEDGAWWAGNDMEITADEGWAIGESFEPSRFV